MVQVEYPGKREQRREKEWNFFQVPYSLREKLMRADSIQNERETHEWAEKYLQEIDEYLKWSSEQNDGIVAKVA